MIIFGQIFLYVVTNRDGTLAPIGEKAKNLCQIIRTVSASHKWKLHAAAQKPQDKRRDSGMSMDNINFFSYNDVLHNKIRSNHTHEIFSGKGCIIVRNPVSLELLFICTPCRYNDRVIASFFETNGKF